MLRFQVLHCLSHLVWLSGRFLFRSKKVVGGSKFSHLVRGSPLVTQEFLYVNKLQSAYLVYLSNVYFYDLFVILHLVFVLINFQFSFRCSVFRRSLWPFILTLKSLVSNHIGLFAK